MTEIYLELGAKKVIACALEWPGWCRIGKNEADAQQTLLNYAPRYAPIAQRAGLNFAPNPLDIIERVPGDGGTDFGAPSIVAVADTAPVDAATAERSVALLRAAWEMLDDVLATAPAELRLGPRGGGRHRDEIFAHVVEAERAYARKVGVRHKPFPSTDRTALTALRDALADALRQPSDGTPLVPGGWPQPYAVRRIAWHVVDHLWEIEDRRE